VADTDPRSWQTGSAWDTEPSPWVVTFGSADRATTVHLHEAFLLGTTWTSARGRDQAHRKAGDNPAGNGEPPKGAGPVLNVFKHTRELDIIRTI
jgi:hypothetical protein